MAYTASQAREEFNLRAHNKQLESNEKLIQFVSHGGGRSVDVHFDRNNPDRMRNALLDRGFRVETTYNGRGMKALW